MAERLDSVDLSTRGTDDKRRTTEEEAKKKRETAVEGEDVVETTMKETMKKTSGETCLLVNGTRLRQACGLDAEQRCDTADGHEATDGEAGERGNPGEAQEHDDRPVERGAGHLLAVVGRLTETEKAIEPAETRITVSKKKKRKEASSDCAPRSLDERPTEHYELGMMMEQSAKFMKLKHIALGEYFCIDALSLGKNGNAFDWHDARTGMKYARVNPIDKLLEEQVVGSELVSRPKKNNSD
jgi:hypothetical protein